MVEINQNLNNLMKSLPQISSKITWDKPRFLKSWRLQNFRNNITNRANLTQERVNLTRSDDTRKSHKTFIMTAKNEYDGKL